MTRGSRRVPARAQSVGLITIAAMMIPASDEYNVPGADDAAVQADILATLGRDTDMVRQALDHLARLAGKPLAELDPARRETVAKEFRAGGGTAAATLVRVVLQCYYRDDRVLRSLGLELRAPFPKGHVLEDGDAFRFPSTIDHRFDNPGDKPVRFVWVVTTPRRKPRLVGR